MNWNNNRGSAINKQLKNETNFKNINIKIAYVVNKEMNKWKHLIKVYDNNYGRMIYK